MTSHTLKDYPKDLQKKVTLLTHFRSYLEGEGKPANPAESEETEKKPNSTFYFSLFLRGFWASDNVVYVKKWMKTRHAIMFRLSNKIVQVDFTDKTEIILSSEQKMVTYVNKKGERSEYPLSNALDSSNSEMAKRLKYTKEILTHMLNNGSTQTAPTANPSNAPAS
jgi:polo-like kinase 1